MIELQGISAGQLATVLTAYTPQTEHTANTAAIGVNAAAIAALQGQVAALPAAPDLTPYALAADLAAAEGSIVANASGLVAVNTSLSQGLASKANQSALDALQVEVNGKIDARFRGPQAGQPSHHRSDEQQHRFCQQRHPRNGGGHLCTQVGGGPAGPRRRRPANSGRRRPASCHCLVVLPDSNRVSGRAGPAGRPAGRARRGHFSPAERRALCHGGGANGPAGLAAIRHRRDSGGDRHPRRCNQSCQRTRLGGRDHWDLLVGTNQIRNLHAVAPLSIALANDNSTLSLSCNAYSRAEADALLLPKASESWVLATLGGYYTTQEADDAIAAALTNHFTRAEATANFVAFLAQANTYTDDQLVGYSTTAEMTQAIADALVPLTLSNGQNWNGGPTFNLVRGTNVLRNLSVAGALTPTFQNLDDTILMGTCSLGRLAGARPRQAPCP